MTTSIYHAKFQFILFLLVNEEMRKLNFPLNFKFAQKSFTLLVLV